MYNYLDDKNLNDVYDYLKAKGLYDKIIYAIVFKTDLYKQMIAHLKNMNK